LRYFNYLFASELAIILSTGIKLDDGLRVLAEQNFHELIKTEAARIIESLNRGYSFFESIDNALYSREFKIVINNADRIGFLNESLENYSLYAFNNLNETNKSLLFLIQPVMYGICGLIIVMLYMSILLPMYEMMNSI